MQGEAAAELSPGLDSTPHRAASSLKQGLLLCSPTYASAPSPLLYNPTHLASLMSSDGGLLLLLTPGEAGRAVRPEGEGGPAGAPAGKGASREWRSRPTSCRVCTAADAHASAGQPWAPDGSPKRREPFAWRTVDPACTSARPSSPPGPPYSRGSCLTSTSPRALAGISRRLWSCL
jgi:hypothetical protein